MLRVVSSRASWMFLIFACLPALAIPSSSADEPVGKKQRIERLIDQLASENQKSITVRSLDHRSQAEQDLYLERRNRVYQAADDLLKLGVEAFPQLIDHFDDRRYSFEEDSMATEKVYQRTVGEFCRRLVGRQVNQYRGWKVADPRGTPGFGGSIVPTDAKAWWEKNRGRALWELQADSVRRAIEENKDPRFFKIDSEHRHKLADDAIRANEELLKQLTETNIALPTGPIRPYFSR